MFRPGITGLAHGPNHPTARPVNRGVFSLAWAEPSVYATGANELRGPKRLTNCCGPKRLLFPLLEWAESTVAEFNSDSEVDRTIHLRGPNRLG
ncbi:hypothetical protein LSAT2_027105 [Lamellibrachia satsuma]|nr:hypothetical protein LSAT2_027105 [Lamellibrachia satsuma]